MLLGIDIISIFFMIGSELFALLPLLAYFFIYKKFNTIWISIAFYTLLTSSFLSLIKRYGMQGFNGELDANGVVIGMQEASSTYMYTSYVEGFLAIISILSFVTFSIFLYKEK